MKNRRNYIHKSSKLHDTVAVAVDPSGTLDQYMRVLEKFPKYSENGWHANYLDDMDLGYFGDPGNDENGLRTMGNFIFVTCLLASDSRYDNSYSGVDQQILKKRAIACLRYMCRSHLTGDIECAGGGQWGNEWQSSWWTTKMAMGAHLIWNQLNEDDQKQVERVVVYEASRQLDRVMPSGLSEDTKAEENAWDGEILAVACAMFFENSKAPRWREKLIEIGFNTLSVPQDRYSSHQMDGRSVSDSVYTVNLHSDFTLENHGAFHFCYAASPLLSITWSWFSLLSNGLQVPESLFHNVKQLWSVVKPTFLGDRFAYIGGKDWARYTYGLYFIVPALVMLQHIFSDTDARNIEIARLLTLETEQQENNDGSFFGKRVTHSRMLGQEAKYETDCFACLGLAYLLHSRINTSKKTTPSEQFEENLNHTLVSPESQVCYVRSSRLFASFSWRTLTSPDPIALFIPNGMDSAVEWSACNLLGRVYITGERQAVGVHAMKQVGQGFIVNGVTDYRKRGKLVYSHHLHFYVDAAEGNALIESKYISRARQLIVFREGLSLSVANDRFNDYNRFYQWEDGEADVRFIPGTKGKRFPGGIIWKLWERVKKFINLETTNTVLGLQWVNIDNKLGIIQLIPNSPPFILRRTLTRNTFAGCLHYDVLCSPKRSIPFIARSGDILLYAKFLLIAGSAEQTRELAADPSRFEAAHG